jgi:hypothetical protein
MISVIHMLLLCHFSDPEKLLLFAYSIESLNIKIFKDIPKFVLFT